ncbi:MAG TPA: GAF domain-containing protein [Roseiflexaceae bacterium]|nr:GAF domain-containing protein [Roseiflexaceae bacterium]
MTSHHDNGISMERAVSALRIVARTQALAEATKVFAQAGQDLDTVLELVVQRVAELVGGACAIRLIDEDGQHLRLAALYHPDAELANAARELLAATPQRLDEGTAAVVMQGGEAILVPAVDLVALRATLRPVFWPHIERWPISSLLSVPLRTRAGTLGIISMTRYAGEPPYTSEDQEFLLDLADRAALAIANAQLYRAAEQARAAAEQAAAQTLRLQTLTAALSEALTPAEATAIVARHVVEIFGATSGAIGLVDAEGGALELVQILGYAPAQLAPWQRQTLEADTPGPDVVRSGQAQFWESRAELLAHYPQIPLASVRSEAWAIVPLRAEGHTLGVLSLGFAEPRRFSADERAFLDALARQCATAVQRTQRYAATEQARAAAEQAAERTSRLQQVTAALGAAVTPDAVAEIVVREGMAAVGADAASIFVFDPATDTFLLLCHRNYPDELVPLFAHQLADWPGPLRALLQTRTIVVAEAPDEQARRWPALTQVLQQTGDEATALVPLLLDEQVLGAFYLAFRRPHHFSAEEQALLLALCQQCAQALERARLYEAERTARLSAERTAKRTARLYAVTTALGEVLTPEQVAGVIVPQGVAALGAQAGSMRQLSADGSALVALRVTGYPSEVLRRWQSIPLDAPVPMAEAVRTARPLLLESRETVATNWPHLGDTLDQLGWQAAALIPLMVGSRPIGTISFGFNAPRRFSAEDRDFLDALARQCVIALERARLYQEAQEAVQIRDQFLSVAAHELKTPLTSLSGQAQLLQRRLRQGQLPPDRLARSVDIIVRQSDRLDAMVRALLDVGRLERGQFVLECVPVELVGLIGHVVDEVQLSLDGHSLEYETDPAPITVDADPLRLEQVIQNLLSNAIKYSPSGGTITVRVARGPATVTICVSDQGVGIPQTALPQLFQRFYRAENVTAHHISGMGIGLYVVREIVGLHGGTVEVASAEGQGSTFTITLPLAER